MTLPPGTAINWRSQWSSSNAYAAWDGVTWLAVQYVAIQAIAAGPALPPDQDPAWILYLPQPPPSPLVRELSNVRLQFMLPSLYAPGDTTRQLAVAVAAELDSVWQTLDDIPRQTYVEVATWGIDQMELEVALPPEPTAPLELRRQQVRAILTPADPITLEAVRAYLARFSYGTVDLTYVMGLTLTVTFTDIRGQPLGVQGMQAGLDAMVPAWITIAYQYRYTTHAEIKTWNGTPPTPHGGTLAELKALGMTHAQISTWTPP